ncbi:MAG: glutamate--tRNA ligase [Thermoanaerobaculia bacterium]|nr:MAG: glutamate--tRNA ligase [Thermoanaerobaculia bacterium]
MTSAPLPGAVRVRFAPSPTGYLHIGGVRTAMFNWLFARRHGGVFVLRVDDTDQQRNLAEALAPILDGFRWLGLDWDEGPEVGGPCAPYYQSERAPIYQRAVDRLLARGFAYRDFARAEEIQAERAEAEAAKRPYLASRRWAAASDAERARFEAEGRTAVVRLKMPRAGTCRIDDAVRGTVATEWAAEADHVVQRADGTCLYHLASVVDDVEMGITHVVRAEEHLPNTPRQVFIFEGLEAKPPVFAHLPVVAEPGSRVKLSKRKLDKYLKNPEFAELYGRGRRIAERLGLAPAAETFNPVIVDFYRIAGFLPEALLNYLLLLGWSLDDRTEMLTREERIAHFDLARVNKAAASFDPRKLMAFQERYMQALDVETRVALCLPFVQRAGWIGSPTTPADRDLVAGIVAAAGDRIKVAGDVLDYEEFFVEDERLIYDEKAFDKRIRNPPGAVGLLGELRAELAALPDFSAPSLEASFGQFVGARGLGLGNVVHAARVAVSGKAIGFGLFDILALLGRERVVARLERAVERAGLE